MFPEPTILCVILSNREDSLHTYVRMYLKARLCGPAYAFSPRLTCMGSNMNTRTHMYLLVFSGKECVHKEGAESP